MTSQLFRLGNNLRRGLPAQRAAAVRHFGTYAISFIFLAMTAQADTGPQCIFEYALSPEQEQSITNLATQGNVCAAENLGNFYYSRQKYKDSLKWYERATKAGSARAGFEIAMMYRNGFLIDRVDESKEMFWKEQAAQKGFIAAQIELGHQYVEGIGVDADKFKGMYWYEQAAQQGNAEAQYVLNTLFLAGSDEIQFSTDNEMEARYQSSKAKANYWLCMAASNGMPQAQYEISRAFDDGRGVLLPTLKQKVLWLYKAAENGSYQAQEEVAWLERREWLTKFEEQLRLLPDIFDTHATCSHDATLLD